MSAQLDFDMAIETAYDLLRNISCSGEVFSEHFGLNLRKNSDSSGGEIYTFDSSSAKSRGVKAAFTWSDDTWFGVSSTPARKTDPDVLDRLNDDCDVLVRTLNSPIHFRRGGDGADGYHAVLDLLASLSMPLVAKCELATLTNALAEANLLLAPSDPWDGVPYPVTSDQDFSIVADPEGEMVILCMAKGTWIVRLDQAGIDWILTKLGVARAFGQEG